MSDIELVALVCCDLAGIVRGRSLPSAELAAQMDRGVGWVPADHALTALGPLVEPNPFGSSGDLRLLPDRSTLVRLERDEDPFELLLCDIVEIDGLPWEGCPRRFLREALDALERELGARLRASFEHEFVLDEEEQPGLPFSLEAQRRASPFPVRVMDALRAAGLEPERFLAEFSAHQFEIPTAAAEGLGGADRAVIFRGGGARGGPLRRTPGELPAAARSHRRRQRRAHPPQPDRGAGGLAALRPFGTRPPERAGSRVRGRRPAPRTGSVRVDRRQPGLLPEARPGPLGGGGRGCSQNREALLRISRW